jgi:hypothetical protein
MMKRNPLPDLLKGFAVFLIIPIHILESFIDYPGRESFFGKTLLLLGGPVAVPIFMMVMGYFVSISKKSWKQLFFRGILIFILGFLLNVGLNFHLLLKIQFADWQLDPFQYIFGVDIFYLAGLSIILLAVLKRIKKGQQWIVLSLILFISMSTSYFNKILMVTDRNYILPFIGGEYSWSYFPLFPWLTYPLVGFLFQKTEFRIRQFIQKKKTVSIAILSSILILVVLFSQFGVKTTIKLPEYYHHTFSFFLWAMGVDVLWLTLLWFIAKKFSEFPVIIFLRWLGKNITVFYVVQWVILLRLSIRLKNFQHLDIGLGLYS